MGNCLVTKLKGTVDNTNLKGFGTIRVHITEKTVTDPVQQRLAMRIGEDTTVKVIGSGNYLSETAEGLANPVNKILFQNDNYGAGHTVFFVNGTYDVEISGKYTIGVIAGSGVDVHDKVYSFDLSDFEYSNEFYYLGFAACNVTGDISSLKNLVKLQNIFLQNNPNVTGDVSSFANLTEVENIQLDVTQIGGKVEDLAVMRKVSEFWITGCNVGGNLEDFANAILPKASGSIRFVCNNNIKVNGSVVGNDNRYIYFGSSMSGKNPTEAETAQGWCIRNS